MKINRLYLKNYRSYSEAVFDFSDGVNVITGANGLGKTNLIEAIYILSGARSWRSGKNIELVKWETDGAYVFANVSSRGREFEMKLALPARGRGSVTINDVRIQKKAKMSEVLRCVIFSPEDLFLIKGPSARRRGLLDGALCQLSIKYADNLSRYEKILEQKKKILNSGENLALLTEYNYQLAFYGAQIVSARAELCDRLQEKAMELHRMISGGKEEFKLEYKTVSAVSDPKGDVKTIAEEIHNHLKVMESAEIAAESCLSGVHKDDLVFTINGRDAKAYASQGQSRTAAVALKFAERELLREGDEYPLLLLDDVMSELDEPRQGFIASHALGGQTFISCCNEIDISGSKTRIIRIE